MQMLNYSEALVLSEALSQYLANQPDTDAAPTETERVMLYEANRLLDMADAKLAS